MNPAAAIPAALRSEVSADDIAPEALHELMGLDLGGLIGQFQSERGTTELDSLHTARALSATLQLETLERVGEALRRSGIPGTPFRGVALLRDRLYLPHERAMSDLDLLVPFSRRREAFETLVSAGFRPWGDGQGRPDPTPGWLDAVTLDAPASSPNMPITVDLHWRVSRGGLRLGASGLEDDLPKTALPGLNGTKPWAHLLHIAEHALRHLRVSAHLIAFADLIRLAPAVSDWGSVVNRGREGPLRAGVAALLEATRAELGAGIPADVPRAISELSPSEIAAMSPTRLAQRAAPGRLNGLRMRVRWSGSVVRGAADLGRAGLPDRTWLRDRYPQTAAPFRLVRFWLEGAAWLAGLRTSPVSGNQEFEIPDRRAR